MHRSNDYEARERSTTPQCKIFGQKTIDPPPHPRESCSRTIIITLMSTQRRKKQQQQQQQTAI